MFRFPSLILVFFCSSFVPATGPRQPWHDIHCKVEGPIAEDILFNFEDRWAQQVKKLQHLIPEKLKQQLVSNSCMNRVGELCASSVKEVGHIVKNQIIKTVDSVKENVKDINFSVSITLNNDVVKPPPSSPLPLLPVSSPPHSAIPTSSSSNPPPPSCLQRSLVENASDNANKFSITQKGTMDIENEKASSADKVSITKNYSENVNNVEGAVVGVDVPQWTAQMFRSIDSSSSRVCQGIDDSIHTAYLQAIRFLILSPRVYFTLLFYLLSLYIL